MLPYWGCGFTLAVLRFGDDYLTDLMSVVRLEDGRGGRFGAYMLAADKARSMKYPDRFVLRSG
jgi:hypothetical protein